jgi:hypothetical protein
LGNGSIADEVKQAWHKEFFLSSTERVPGGMTALAGSPTYFGLGGDRWAQRVD